MGRSTCLSAETLSAFLDAELAEPERRDAQQHLRECAECSGELATYRSVEAVVAAPAPVECATAVALLSARHDRELTQDEALVAEAHAATCLSCRSDLAAFDGLDVAIAGLPVAIPSRKVDAAIAALVDRETVRSRRGRRGLVAGLALRGAVATALVGAILLAALQPQGGGGPQEALQPPAPIAGGGALAIVASVQQVLLNPRTNTLYVAHPDDGTVGAFNATTQEDIATIRVGGRPVALALNESANRILVLDDSSTQSLIEIDGATNTVLSSTVFAVSGTVTAIQVDPANGNIFAAVTSAQPQTPPALVVLDGSTKKTESTRTVPVAAQRMVLDQLGQRALLVSDNVTTLVDASTFKQLDQLPGGVAATFSANGSVAVLSVNGGGSRITIAGAQNASATFDGAPLALIALPQGGYAALVDDGTSGRIVELSADGTVVKTATVSLVGHDLTYNAKTKQYAVAGDRGLAYVGGPAAAAPNTPSAVPTPGASTPPSAATTPAAPAPVAAIPGPQVEKQAALPEAATLAWQGMYRLDLVDRGNPTVVGHGRAGHLWYVDSANRLTALDTLTGDAFTIAQLPRAATIRSVEVGTSFVYAIDVSTSVVYVVSLPSEKVTPVKLPFVKSSEAVTITPDDTLWFAVADQILRFDPRTSLWEAANVGLYSVGAMASDSAGRVWFTDEAHDKIALYDRRNHSVTEMPLPRKGAVTSMVVDASGTLWAGTDAGELFAIRSGQLAGTTLLARPVLELALDGRGNAWFLGSDARGGTFGQVQGPASAQVVPASIAGLWFDAGGHAWLADRSSAGFFIAVPGAR